MTLIERVTSTLRALRENPQLVNGELPRDTYVELLQVVLDCAEVLAFDLSDLKETAEFPPMRIEVTSHPIWSKPYRLTR